MAYIGRNIKYQKIEDRPDIDMEQCREEFRGLLLAGCLSSVIPDVNEEAVSQRHSFKSLPPVGTFPTSGAVLKQGTSLGPSLGGETSSPLGATASNIPMPQKANKGYTAADEEAPGDEIKESGNLLDLQEVVQDGASNIGRWLQQNKESTAQNFGHPKLPRCVGPRSSMAASSVSPTMSALSPIATGTYSDMQNEGLDDTDSESEFQWPLKYNGAPNETGTDDQNSTPARQQVDLAADLTTDLTFMKALNQDITWECNGVDMVKKFAEFQLTNSKNYSFALDGIADLSPGSSFETTLPSYFQPEIYLSEITPIDVYNKWPNFSHYFVFRDDLPTDLNEREAFVGFSWAFIRGALTMTKIETRFLEVQITGVEERKNQDKDLRFEKKQAGELADGIGFHGSSQIYLAEASTLNKPRAGKLQEDEFKLVRAMRDSWISQIRATCRESIPCRTTTVFGSSSYKDETKIWQMDFKGVFQLFQIDSFLIPREKQDFGWKMKSAALSCIEMACRVQVELQKRKAEAVPASYQERVELNKAVRRIRPTAPTPEKLLKRKSV
ncbi:hypothetical protein BGZ58_002502 [Dissophora ornata]|nr:hypothetical protein BGZ58_002502 [Dissophora ornata]